jgi:phosphoenolpyruvate-protein kinase (PTS system EI component)
VDREGVIVLLVQEDKTDSEMGDPEAQLFAKAVAAIQSQNKLLRNSGLPPVKAKVMAGIIMSGSAPIFYKIDITAALLKAIETGQYPAQVTVIHKFEPTVAGLRAEGMRSLENRAVLLSCFEAFKAFI